MPILKRKKETNNLTLHLKELEGEEQTRPKDRRRKQIVKIRPKINKIKNRNIIESVKPKSFLRTSTELTDL